MNASTMGRSTHLALCGQACFASDFYPPLLNSVMTNVLGNLKIGTRLGASFAVILLLLSLVGAMAVFQASRIYDGTEKIADNRLPSVQVLGDIRALANDVRRASLGSVMETEPTGKEAQRAKRNDAMAKLSAAIEAYQKLVSSPEEEQLNQNIKKAWNDYVVLDGELLEFSEAGESSFAEARNFATGESATAFTAVTNLIEDDIQLSSRSAVSARTAAAQDYRAVVVCTGVLIVVALAMGVFIAFLITRSITSPLHTSVSVAETVARGDLTSRIDTGRRDEVGQLLQSLKAMNGNLATVVTGIRSTTESVSVASQEIASGNTDLSARTEEQAASLEETAASMTQLTETVKQNADNARQANVLATRATDLADAGNDAVQSMVGTIEGISGSSSKISEITGVIEGIAFQTNILALNAAVEAARAGGQGRGFAVVASEVRSLAQRSASAAKEIKELIGSSVAMIHDGARQATDVGATMAEVKQAIKQVSDIVGEIAVASEEQSRGIEQINQAVSQMDEVTQQNAALVEQAAAAAHSLEEQAKNLKEAVSVFKLAETEPSLSRVIVPQSNPARKAAVTREKSKAVEKKSDEAGSLVTATSQSSTASEWETF